LTEPFSERYLKKLFGNGTDIEDALKRLDVLTQEETQMAAAQVLKATHAVDDSGRVRGVADIALSVDNRVAGVDERVSGVDDRVAGVDDRVAGVDDRVAGVDERVAGVDEHVAGVDERVAGVGDRVEDVDDRVKAVDEKLVAVINGAQYIFNQSSKFV
jgi:archaellum component FlaC